MAPVAPVAAPVAPAAPGRKVKGDWLAPPLRLALAVDALLEALADEGWRVEFWRAVWTVLPEDAAGLLTRSILCQRDANGRIVAITDGTAASGLPRGSKARHTLRRRAVAGINCISPCAPAGDVASGSYFDSCLMTA